jgi:hypothetical protein
LREEHIQPVGDLDLREKLHTVMARVTSSIKACHDEDERVLHQYHTKGYDEVEVANEDDDDDDDNCDDHDS